MAPPPNFIKGVGRLATDRYDFQDHLEGINPPGFTDFRHTADQIDMNPAVLGGATTVQGTLNDVAAFIAAQAGAGQGFVTVGSGYDTYHNANGQIAFDISVPALDTLLNPVFASIVAFQTAVAAGSANPPPVTVGFERIRFGGIVVIEAGTYIVKQPINVPPGITLLGEGYGTKIVNATNLNTSILPPQVRTPSLVTASAVVGGSVQLTVEPPLTSLVNGSYINISNAGPLGSGSGTWTINNVSNVTNVSTSFTLNNNTIPASNFNGALVTTMAPIFVIDQDTNRIAPPGDDGAVDTNLFMFSEETKIMNMVIADNFVESTTLGDSANYRLPQNYTSSTYFYPPPLIQQTAGSSLVLDGVILMGRVSINNSPSSGVVSAVTGTAVGLVSEWFDGFATAFASPSILKVTNCFIDGFSSAILFFGVNGGADYLEVNNSKIRAYGYFDGDGSTIDSNFMFGVNDSTTKIIDNILYANTPALATIGAYVYISGASSPPPKQARGKLLFATNDLIVSKIFTPSNSVTSSIANVHAAPANISNYLSILEYGNNLQDSFNINIDGVPVLSASNNATTIFNGVVYNAVNPLTSSITTTATTPIVVTVPIANMVSNGDVVFISGNSGGANGSWSTIQLSPTTFSLTGSVGTSSSVGTVSVVDHNISATDYMVIPPTGSGASSTYEIILPTIVNGRALIIKDPGFASNSNIVIISAQAGQTFDASGISTYTISTPASSISLTGYGNIWYIT